MYDDIPTSHVVNRDRVTPSVPPLSYSINSGSSRYHNVTRCRKLTRSYLVGGGLIVRRRCLFRPLHFSVEPKKGEMKPSKFSPNFAPVMHFSPVIILSLLLFVAFGTWFPPRSAWVAVWHIAAVRILYYRPPRIPLLLRRGRSHSLEGTGKERARWCDLLTTLDYRSWISCVVIDRSIRQCNPKSHLYHFHFGGQSLRLLPLRSLLLGLKDGFILQWVSCWRLEGLRKYLKRRLDADGYSCGTGARREGRMWGRLEEVRGSRCTNDFESHILSPYQPE